MSAAEQVFGNAKLQKEIEILKNLNRPPCLTALLQLNGASQPRLHQGTAAGNKNKDIITRSFLYFRYQKAIT